MLKCYVEILMATFNGEKYLKDQIDSLLNQTHSSWTLLIRDDGSTDNTIKIIKEYIKKYPHKIRLLTDEKGSLGAKNNFLELLKNSTEEYVMFCDQDDIWLDTKIEITLNKMFELDVKGIPLLVHSDLIVVDKDLKKIADSFWKFQNLNPYKKKYKDLIVQNNITGCTMMLNKKLVELCKKEYNYLIMHDWLIGIIASLNGRIVFLENPTILYRQHGKNSVGARKYNITNLIVNLFTNFKEINKFKNQGREQISEILHYVKINTEQEKEIKNYIDLKNKNFIIRKIWIIKHKYLMQGIFRKIGQILFE